MIIFGIMIFYLPSLFDLGMKKLVADSRMNIISTIKSEKAIESIIFLWFSKDILTGRKAYIHIKFKIRMKTVQC